MSGAVLWKRRDPYYGLGAAGMEAALRERLRGRVEAAWFFGSHAAGAVKPDSDIDLILVAATDLPFTRRAAGFDDLYELVPALDLLVYTPEEFRALTEEPTAGFWTSVAATLKRLL
jgi:predicted nucleotidyltransferase